MVDIMGADAPKTQGARASATMILFLSNRINSVHAREGMVIRYTNI